MKDETIKRYYLSDVIYICSNCNRIDVKTYAKYKKKGTKYILQGRYKECQDCGNTEMLED